MNSPPQGKELSAEPCVLLDAADSWLYLVFPESGLCCRSCNTSEFCGIIAPRWLQNATYQGVATIGGVECEGWMKQGGEQNFYYVTTASRCRTNARQPCQYYEGYPTLDVGVNQWNFTYAAYSTAPIPADVFAVPADMQCEQACPHSPMSYAQRLRARHALGLGSLREL